LEIKVLSEDIPGIKGIDADISAWEQGYFIRYTKDNMRIESPLEIAIPKSPLSTSYIQKSAKSDNFFLALVDKKEEIPTLRKKPKQIEIIIDSSLNLVHKDFRKEFAFMDTLFKDIENCQVSLKRLDIDMHDEGTYEVKDGKWKALKQVLMTMQYDGAKDLSKLKTSSTADEVWFFSNGINTFSDSISVQENMISINSSVGANHNTLKYISQKYINLRQEILEDAFKKYKDSSDIRIDKKSKRISDIFIKDVGDAYLVLGRIDKEKGFVTFSKASQHYRVNIDNPKASTLIARVWAKEKIDALSLRYKNNKAQINHLAKKYTIVTKDMSLIVLDRIEDYVRYEIVPPTKALQEQYNALLTKEKKHKKSQKEQAIQEAISLLKEQKYWYKKDFIALWKENKRERKENKSMTEEDEAVGGDILPAPVMEASMSVAPMAEKMKSAKKTSIRMPQEASKTIKLKEWKSDAPYLKKIESVKKNQHLATYHLLQAKYINSIPFYLDMSQFFYTQGNKTQALLILSNILELDFENTEYMRAFAFKLLELDFHTLAVRFFEKIEILRPFEAQASRDLALSYEGIKAYQKALDTHYAILTKQWDGRFIGSKIVTINELNHLISTQKLDLSNIDKRLIYDMPVGMRIVINWSTDNSDMDLWVIDPNDEKTYYAHRESKIGGKISNDMTRGYGPEEFMIRKALRGTYQIKVKYFASSAQNIMGETVIRAEIFTDYASKKEKKEEIVFRVKEAKEVIDIGEIVY